MTEERKYDLEAFPDLQDRLDILMHLDGLLQILKENDAWNTMLVDTARNVTKRYITFEELEHMLGLMVLSRDITSWMRSSRNCRDSIPPIRETVKTDTGQYQKGNTDA